MAVDFNANKLKTGDKVVRITEGCSGMSVGGTYVVRESLTGDEVHIEGFDTAFASENFVLVQSQPMPEKVRDPHPHAEVAKAWLDGYPIEIQSGGKWVSYGRINNQGYVPGFNPKREVRIQPVESEKAKQIKELVRQAEDLLAKAKELEATK